MRHKKILTAVTLFYSCLSLAQIPTTGLVANFPFSGNANNIVSGGTNATINGATLTIDRFSRINNAYHFNGTSSISAISNFGIDSGDVSISCWLRSTDSSNTTETEVVGLYNSQYYIEPSIRYSNNNRISAIRYNTCVNGTYTPSKAIQTNLWYNAILTYNHVTDTLKFYVGGNLISSIKTSGFGTSCYNSPSKLTIGADYSNGSSTFFKGDVDDVLLYNRVLTTSEIQAIYNASMCSTTDTTHVIIRDTIHTTVYDTIHTNIYDTINIYVSVTDTLIINAKINTGINAYTLNKLTIYPNPASDHLNINTGNYTLMNGYQLKIVNSIGQTVYNTNINQQSYYLDLSNWGGYGIYFIHVINPQNQSIEIKKIILQK